MALSQEQVNLLAQGLAGSRTKSGSMAVTTATQAKKAPAPKATFDDRSAIRQVTDVIGGTAKAVGGLAVGAAKYVGKEITEIPGEVYRTATRVIPTAIGFGERSKIRELNREIEVQSKSIDAVFSDYKSGRITKNEYQTRLAELNEGQKDIRQRGEQVVVNTDPKQATEDFADTALLLTTFGLGKVASASAKPGGLFLGKTLSANALKSVNVVNTAIEKGITKLAPKYGAELFGKTVTKSFTAGVAESIAQGAYREALTQVASKDALKLAANKLLLKYPLTYHQIFDDITTVADYTSKGNFVGAGAILLLDATALVGGPIMAASEFAKKLGISSQRAMFGTNSFWDEFSARAAGGNRNAIGEFVNSLKNTDPERHAKAMDWMKSIQAVNLHASRDNVKIAVDSIDNWFAQHGVKLSDLPPKEAFESIEKYGRALDSLHSDLRMGIGAIDPSKANSVMLGRWDQKARDSFADMIEKSGSKEQAQKLLAGAAEEQVVWTHNETLNKAVKDILDGVEVDMKLPKGKIYSEARKFATEEDFIQSKSIFRGQPKEFTQVQRVEDSDVLSNILVGRGVFTTSDSSMAKTYGENILTFKKPTNAKKILDLSNATTEQMDALGISKDTQKFYRQLLDEPVDTGYIGRKYEIDGETYNVVNIFVNSKTKVREYKLANLKYGGGQKYIPVEEFETKYKPKTNYSDKVNAEEILFEAIAEKQLPEDITWNMVKMGGADALSDGLYIDEVRDRILKSLTDSGYDYIKHQGGIRAGGGAKLHDVYIALKNEALKPQDINKLKEVYKKATQGVEGFNLKKAAAAIRDIDAQKMYNIRGLSKETRQLMNEGGYIPIIPKRSLKQYIAPEQAGELVSDAIEGAANTYKPIPGLEQIGSALKKVGLSTEDSTMQVNKMMRENFDNALQDVQIKGIPIGDSKGAWVANKLSNYMESLPQYVGTKLPAQDARVLTLGEIAKVLDVDKATAKQIQKSLLEAYTSLPLSVRGLGDSIVDFAYAKNPLQRAYSRVQGALRYSWNPFFRLQEISETEILSQALTGGKTPSFLGVNGVQDLFFKQTSKRMNDAAKLLDERGVFSGTLGGEAAQDAVIGRITANLTKTQKRSLAGMALKIAEVKGTTLENMLNENIDEIADALRVVVQYPKKSVLNSSLAKTMNLAFFPTRYNLKVTSLAAKALSTQPPAIQLAVVNGLYDARKWLNSDEGIVWQSENQDAIRVFKWITPYGSIESALKLLNGNKIESIGELGQLGGLPFGIITQMLDSQTDFEVNTPYMDLKTGKVFPDYIPETTKARAATALTDVLMSLFTYPGRTLGLPGKSQAVRGAVQGVFNVDKEEYNIVMPEDGDYTDTQKRQMQVLEEAGIKQTDTPRYDYVFDGYSWKDSGYYIPMDVIKAAKETAPDQAPARLPVPTKSQVKAAKKRTPASERIARPIEKR